MKFFGRFCRRWQVWAVLRRAFRPVLPCFSAMCLLLLLSSCYAPKLESGRSGQGQQGVPQSGLDIVNDVPIPRGAVLDRERSLVLGRGSNWTGRLVFRVNRPTTALFSLYQSEMPQFGWQSLSVIQDEVSILQYTLGSRLATVRVSGLGFRGSRVSILMAPRAGGGGLAPSQPGSPSGAQR